jgi:hypothetical protein
MARDKRSGVEERQRRLVVEHDVGRLAAGHDFAERAGSVGHEGKSVRASAVG